MLVIGMVTFGNLKYTKMAINALKDHTDAEYHLIVVAGQNGDGTAKYCKSQGIEVIEHTRNWGFPKSINDIYETAWKRWPDCYIVIVGNDVLVYPNSVDVLVEYAETTDYEWLSGIEIFTPKKIIKKFPEYQKLFKGDTVDLIGKEFDGWKRIKFDISGITKDMGKFGIIGDTHNLCLFKPSVFHKIGFVDVNYYPAYFEDNDYARRAQLMGTKLIRISDAKYFHFWSRTIHEAGQRQTNDKYFPQNKKFYRDKWGGEPGKEKWQRPFNDEKHNLRNGGLRIGNRKEEDRLLRHWMAK